MIENEASTILNIARMILLGLDKSRIETPVQTETLRLLLETLIAWGEPTTVQDMQATAKRTVLGHMVAVEEAERARDGKVA